jgi:tRNA isopentenyl-2-thiomethyl-A-37 hydroxylase MiaE
MAETKAIHAVAVQAVEGGNIMITVDDDMGRRNVHLGFVAASRFALSLQRAVQEQSEKLFEQGKAAPVEAQHGD